ncbi:MAG TPA: GNAT family N-acetyltransferase [Nitrospirae bacterium]|nr:hypothetical protein BMS3Abin06_00832 [bacterium BMS3Abin06]HDH11594.1 GNAT family N-acetyltransferase [Nitrospirota bacterium]HDH51198.1 GNAT family N-acetyltransferase [Nitrospirota bacterium]HDZ02014.1 GNAT family N-acetyltransferase [Nitrospirota bacterium]
MSVQKNYCIEKYKDGDEKEINRLYNEIISLPGYRTLEEWHWKMKENPAKVKDLSNYISLAKAEGKIVGQYASWPVDIKCGEQILKAAHPMENFIHPDFRLSFQVQLDMSNKQFELGAKEDVRFGFGFPNEAAYLIGKRFLGYKDMGKLVTLSTRLSLSFPVKRRMPFLPEALLSIIRKTSGYFYKVKLKLNSREPDLSVEEIHRFNDDFDEFWRKVSRYYPLIAVRNSAYMNWRYFKKPTKEYKVFVARDEKEIKGCIAVKISADPTYYPGARVGFIMELLCLKESGVPERLIKTALYYFLSRGADFSVAVMVENDFLFNSFLKSGYIIDDKIYTHPVVFKPSDVNVIDVDILRDLRNWHITFGDFDPQ